MHCWCAAVCGVLWGVVCVTGSSERRCAVGAVSAVGAMGAMVVIWFGRRAVSVGASILNWCGVQPAVLFRRVVGLARYGAWLFGECACSMISCTRQTSPPVGRWDGGHYRTIHPARNPRYP